MKTFTDSKKRKWSVIVDVAAIKRVRDLTKLDLMQIVEGREVIEKLTNPSTIDELIFQIDVLYAICKPDADKAAITDENFGEAMGGDAREAAIAALLEGLADFFPSHRQKPFKRALERLQEIRAKSMGMVMDRLNSPELEAEALSTIRAAIEAPLPTSGKPSGTAQASSA